MSVMKRNAGMLYIHETSEWWNWGEHGLGWSKSIGVCVCVCVERCDWTGTAVCVYSPQVLGWTHACKYLSSDPEQKCLASVNNLASWSVGGGVSLNYLHKQHKTLKISPVLIRVNPCLLLSNTSKSRGWFLLTSAPPAVSLRAPVLL